MTLQTNGAQSQALQKTRGEQQPEARDRRAQEDSNQSQAAQYSDPQRSQGMISTSSKHRQGRAQDLHRATDNRQGQEGPLDYSHGINNQSIGSSSRQILSPPNRQSSRLRASQNTKMDHSSDQADNIKKGSMEMICQEPGGPGQQYSAAKHAMKADHRQGSNPNCMGTASQGQPNHWQESANN